MYINCTNICANGTGFITVHVITRRKKRSETSPSISPVTESLMKCSSCFFPQSKAINDTEHAWAPVALVRLLCFAPSAFSMTTRAQRQKRCFMKTPPSNSSFHIFPHLFFPSLPLFSTNKRLKVIFISLSAISVEHANVVLLTLFISTDRSRFPLLNHLLWRVITLVLHNLHTVSFWLLQIYVFGSNVHNINRYSGQSPHVL